jgi:hypothetical protein
MATLPPSSLGSIANELASIERGEPQLNDGDLFEQVAQAIKATEGSPSGSVSHLGAQGAWQVMPATRKAYAKRLGLDPEDESEETIETVARAKIADDLQAAMKLANGDRAKAARYAAAAYFGGPDGMKAYAKGKGAARNDGILNIDQYVDRFSKKLGLPAPEKKGGAFEDYWLKGNELQSEETDQAGRIQRQQAADESPYSTSFKRGVESMAAGAKSFVQTGVGDTQGAAKTIAEHQAWQEKNPAPSVVQDFHNAWEEGNYIGALTSGGFGAANVEQLANSAPGMLGMAIGAVIGGPAIGGFIGATLGNTLPEGGEKIASRLQKAGVNPSDPVAVQAYIDQHRGELLLDGTIKGLTVSAFDALALKGGVALFGAPMANLATATDTTLVKMGVNLGDKAAVQAAKQTPRFKAAIAPAVAEYKAATTLGKTIGRTTGMIGIESAGEFGGEYIGQELSGDEGSFSDSFLEMVMSGGQSAVTTAGGMLYSKLKQNAPVNLEDFKDVPPAAKSGASVPQVPPGTVPPAPKANSPLTNAANAGTAAADQMAANDPLRSRLDAIRPLIEGSRVPVQPSPELGVRGKAHTERAQSVLDRLDPTNRKEILEAWAIARNPTVRPEQRDFALSHLEAFVKSIPDFQMVGETPPLVQ